MSPKKWGVFGALAAVAALALVPVDIPAAHAAGTVVVTPDPSPDGETVVTVSGSGFQYVPNAPDGIYVMFGVVSDPASNAWAPSQGGAGGVTYSYSDVPGSIAAIGFEGGEGFADSESVIRPDGTWSTEFTIPGSSFVLTAGIPTEGEEAEGEVVDCFVETCGIITIGAKGAINANNETFTPITFAESEPEPEPEPEPAPEPEQVDEADDAAEEPTDEVADAGSNALPWIIAGGVAVVLGLIAWGVAAARKRGSVSDESGSDSPADSTDLNE